MRKKKKYYRLILIEPNVIFCSDKKRKLFRICRLILVLNLWIAKSIQLLAGYCFRSVLVKMLLKLIITARISIRKVIKNLFRRRTPRKVKMLLGPKVAQPLPKRSIKACITWRFCIKIRLLLSLSSEISQ